MIMTWRRTRRNKSPVGESGPLAESMLWPGPKKKTPAATKPIKLRKVNHIRKPEEAYLGYKKNKSQKKPKSRRVSVGNFIKREQNHDVENGSEM